MSTDIAEYKPRVLAVQQVANEYSVTNAADVAAGEQLLRDIKAVETGMGERKTEITRPLMKSLASVRDLFKPLEEGLADAKKTIKSKILAYSVEQEEKAKAEAEAIVQRVEKGTLAADTAAGKLEKLSASQAKTNTRTVRKLHIIDATVIPRVYLMPDREAITKALFAGHRVPGAELLEEKVLVIK